MRDLLARIAGFCVERPLPVLVATVLVAMIGAVGALGLEADAGTDQLVDRDSPAYQGTADFKEEFGDDAVAVLVKGDLEQLVLTSDLATLLSLEACLSGNAPGGEVVADEPAPRPCAALAETKPARVVYGPATFLNQFATQATKLLEEQSEAAVREASAAGAAAREEARRQGFSREQQEAAAAAAAQEVLTAFEEQLYTLALRYGQLDVPRLDDPRFVSSVVFDSRSQGEPKSRFAYLFPSADSALISVRLRPELSEAERRDAIQLIRDAVADPAFRIANAEYVVSGVPVVVEGVAEKLSSEIFVLLAAALAVMALTLAAVFGPPLRLLALAIALASAAITFGGLALLGGSLTLASLAVLPVLIGLAVDYAIQFQARFNEARAAGTEPARSALEAAVNGGSVIGTAALATAAGFLVLLVWPVPVIGTFGALLLAGIAIAYVLSLTAGLAALSISHRLDGRWPKRPPSSAGTERIRALRSSVGGVGRRMRELGKRAVAGSMAASGRLLAAAFVIALAGWVLGARTDVVTDIRELLPQDTAELRDAEEVEQTAGASGEIDVLVKGADLTDPAVIAWMRDYKERVLERTGFDEDTRCLDPEVRLCPFIALTDLFGSSEATPSRARVERLLELMPEYFSGAMIDRDPATGSPGETAVISFGIKVMPLDEQKELIDLVRSEIAAADVENPLPEGVRAEVVGLPVLVADASSGLSDDRHLLTLGGLLAVALALLAVMRSVRRAVVTLIPVVVATGWSSLVIWAFGIDLNPLSATLGALVIAIATEFSVLLTARYEQERARGSGVAAALRETYSRTGAAVLASGLTSVAGFAVLTISGIPLLRDFGLVTVLDLGIALTGVLLVLPAALVWMESGFSPFGLGAPRGRVTEAPSRG